MAEAAAKKVWPFRPAKHKRRKSRSLSNELSPLTPVREPPESGARSWPKNKKSRSLTGLSSDQPLGSVGAESSIQPDAPPQPTVSNKQPSQVRRQRSLTEPGERLRVFSDTPDSAAAPPQAGRPMTELEYLITVPPSARELSIQERTKAREGREDVWLLMLNRKREKPDERLPVIAGNLLWDLESQTFAWDMPMDEAGNLRATIRQEAMLEEAAEIVKMEDSKLGQVLEQARMIEARRSTRGGRRTM